MGAVDVKVEGTAIALKEVERLDKKKEQNIGPNIHGYGTWIGSNGNLAMLTSLLGK